MTPVVVRLCRSLRRESETRSSMSIGLSGCCCRQHATALNTGKPKNMAARFPNSRCHVRHRRGADCAVPRAASTPSCRPTAAMSRGASGCRCRRPKQSQLKNWPSRWREGNRPCASVPRNDCRGCGARIKPFFGISTRAKARELRLRYALDIALAEITFQEIPCASEDRDGNRRMIDIQRIETAIVHHRPAPAEQLLIEQDGSLTEFPDRPLVRGNAVSISLAIAGFDARDHDVADGC